MGGVVARAAIAVVAVVVCGCSGDAGPSGAAGTAGGGPMGPAFSDAGGGLPSDGAIGVLPGSGDGGDAASTSCGSSMARVQAFDLARAAHGKALFETETLAPGILPEFVVRNLWIAWGTPAPATNPEYWEQFRERYGMLQAPFDNEGLPLGMRREEAGITFDCQVCHGGRVAGVTIVGAPNGLIDLESFYDDLLIMREMAPAFGFPQPPVPYDLDGLTHARGAQDAFGIGFRLLDMGSGALNTEFGPQRAPAWWQLAFKERMYVDGSADASGHRATMATLVAFGVTPNLFEQRESDFEDITHYLRSLEAPCWTLTTLDTAKVGEGRALFDLHCASCHGVHSGSAASYPNRIVPHGEVGTDPVRAERFGEPEAAALNASWFGQPPLMSTGGYLAPPLVGIWARAPYFHNGSVPDLLGVLDPAERPARWKRAGTELDDYDTARVGYRYEMIDTPPDPNTREGRQVYDTTREGMGNAGHLYGEALSRTEREALLEYLRSL